MTHRLAHPQLLAIGTGVWIALSLGACTSAPTAKDVHAFTAAPLADAEVLPTAEDNRTRIKVVVVDAADGADRLAQATKLGAHLSRQVEELLARRGVEVVDDALAPKLDEELRKAEALNNGKAEAYTGPKVAKYALKPQLTENTYAAVFKEGRQLSNGALGLLLNSSSGYEHKASVKGVVRVYELPTLKLVGAVNLDGSADRHDARQAANETLGGALLKEAASSAVNNGSAELLNYFAGRGYVVQKRLNAEKKQSAFQVSMGTTLGLKAGDKVEVFSQRPADGATGKAAQAMEEVLVASGVVSSMLLQEDSAWIVLDDEDLAPRVRRGDLVKQKHTRTLFDSLPGVLKSSSL
ncbi:MAG: hypothetical protein RI907_2189 [Pseudomonadota bacterium]|jgi:hypothetical protein